jgi:hypothetical protein
MKAANDKPIHEPLTARQLDSNRRGPLPRADHSSEADHALDQQHYQRDHADLNGRRGGDHQRIAYS